MTAPTTTHTGAPVWTPRDAAELYGLDAWGGGYFGVSERGTVVAHPHGSPEHAIDLHEVVQGLGARDLQPPVVLRFDDILAHRMGHLRRAFDQALAVVAALDRGGCAEADQAGKLFKFGELVIGRQPRMRLGITLGLVNLEQRLIGLLAPGVFRIDGPTAEGRLTLKALKLITRKHPAVRDIGVVGDGEDVDALRPLDLKISP